MKAGLASAALLFPILFAWGCGGGGGEEAAGESGSGAGADVVLAEVGDRAVTSSDFRDAYLRVNGPDRPDLTTLEQRRAFLDDMINKELMELAAYEKYPEPPLRQQWRIKRFHDAQLQALVRRKLVEAKLRITEEMKDQLFQNLHRELHLKAMMIGDPEEAAYVRGQLDEGADFGDLSLDHSMQWSTPEMRGDLGWQTAGNLPWPVDSLAWASPVGTTVGPVEQPLGSFIVRVVEERPGEVSGTRESLDPQLEFKLKQPLYLNRQKAVLDSLHAVEEPYFPPEGRALLMKKYYWEPQDPSNEYEYLDAQRVRPTFTAEEAEMVVVEFKNVPDWTASEFADRLEWYPSGLWPRGQTEEQLQECLDLLVRDFLILKAGKDLNVDQDPEFVTKLENRKREMRVTYFYYNDIIANVDLTQEQIDAYFREHREKYKAAPSYKVAVFTSYKLDMLDDLAKEWRAGASFLDLRKKYEKVDPELKSMGESRWVFQGQDPAADAVVATLKPGGVSAPDVLQDRGSVYRLIDTRGPRLVSYQEIKQQVDEDAKTYYQDQALDTFLEEQKRKHPVTVHQDRLMAVDLTSEEAPESE